MGMSARWSRLKKCHACSSIQMKLDFCERLLPAGGKTPWSFSFSPDGHWLLVANEASGLITEFKVDRRSGKLTVTDKTLAVPTPVSVTFAPH